MSVVCGRCVCVRCGAIGIGTLIETGGFEGRAMLKAGVDWCARRSSFWPLRRSIAVNNGMSGGARDINSPTGLGRHGTTQRSNHGLPRQFEQCLEPEKLKSKLFTRIGPRHDLANWGECPHVASLFHYEYLYL